MLASKDPYINEASNSIFQMNADPQVLKRCIDREEYYLDMQADKKIIAESRAIIEEQKEEIIKLRSLLKKHGINLID